MVGLRIQARFGYQQLPDKAVNHPMKFTLYIRDVKVIGKVEPRTGHEGPEGE
jgi:hypothetical protein